MDKIAETFKKLQRYAKIANDLLYENPHVIRSVSNELKNDIIAYAKLFNHDVSDYSDKRTLNNWQNDSVPYFVNSTSGTTGAPFKYRIWTNIFETIEYQCHYDMINKEFNVTPSNVLYLNMNMPIKHSKIIKNHFTTDIMVTHGNRHKADIAVQNDLYYLDIYGYIQEIFKFKKDYDIIMATGEILDPLLYLIKKGRIAIKQYAYLLSCTGNKTSVSTIRELLNLGIFKYACDHMRCWDGGASFFTCKHGTRHLLDNLCWCNIGEDFKLLSTDYFSLPNPFINYWNGDRADILNEYQHCSCGRYYRPFTLYQAEPEIDNKQILNILGDKLKRVSVIPGGRRVFVNHEPSPAELKSVIKTMSPEIIDIVIEENE